METTVVADDGTRLFVRARNEGHPPGAVRIFLCDGVACDGFIWKYLWNDLASLAPLTHWHYRGHGRSAPPADPDHIRIIDHVSDLECVRKAAGDPPCVLVGHSMGCQIVLETYRQHPDNVRGLVLLCGSHGKVTRTFHDGPLLGLVLPKLLDLVTKNPELVGAIWSRLPVDMALKIALKMGEVDATRVRAEDFMPYLVHMTQVDVKMFLRMVESAGEHSAEDMLPTVKVPVLIVAGERDTFTPAHIADTMHEMIPGSELLLVAQGSHVAAIEQPQLVNDRIMRFLRERVLAQGAAP